LTNQTWRKSTKTLKNKHFPDLRSESRNIRDLREKYAVTHAVTWLKQKAAGTQGASRFAYLC
jgi:hypothetical protein